jgi:hypothetical protein
MVKLQSVIVNDLNVPGIALIETKAQAPLVIDAYAELTRTVALEEFEPIVWGHPQIFKSGGTDQHLQITLSAGSRR